MLLCNHVRSEIKVTVAQEIKNELPIMSAREHIVPKKQPRVAPTQQALRFHIVIARSEGERGSVMLVCANYDYPTLQTERI